MFFRLLLYISLLTLSLEAQPSMAQVKQAVIANPALLETPQAKAAMAEKGITATEVKKKLAQEKPAMNETTFTVENDIEETNDEIDTLVKDKKKEIKRINPFSFKSEALLRNELNEKQQQLLTTKLTRYSLSFYNNKNKIDASSMPTPDNYILSTGDAISVHIYGDREQNYNLKIKSDGTIDIAFIGPVKIAGMEFIKAKEHLINKLKAHYKMSNFNINISKYSTIQVTLVGEVKNPGIYNLSSFSTTKDLLLASKGVRKYASVREIQIRRDSKIIAKLDFYDLLFKGKKFGTTLLENGDIVVVKKAKKLVSIDGFVNHAAVFELNDNEKLSQLIEYAGGIKVNASKFNIKIDRYTNNAKYETFKIDYKKAKNFKMKDGDKVYVYPLDFTAKSSVNFYGNIIRPGSYRLNENKTLHAFFKKALNNGLKSFFLPQTYFSYGVIKRYKDNLTYEIESFNLLDTINGQQNIKLQANDQIFIFNQNDIFANSYVITKGSTLTNPGRLQYFDGMTIKNAVNASGINGVIDDNVRVTTYNTENLMPKTSFYSLKTQGKVKLNPYDELEVYDYYSKNRLEPIYIEGEVSKTIETVYEKDMTLQDLLDIAGGLTLRAYTKTIEIVRYSIDKSQTRTRKILTLNIENENFSKVLLKAYDEVKIFKIPNWEEHSSVVLKGEVTFPGTYSVRKGERLSDVIKRAGGFTDNAFLRGAVFTRESIRKNQERQYRQSLTKIKRELAIFNAMPANAKQSSNIAQATNNLNEVIVEAEKFLPMGRVSLTLDENRTLFEQSEYNLVLKDKDILIIPSQIDTVTVFGEVFNASSFVHVDGLDVDAYLNLASGLSKGADEDNIYVIHADGTSEPAYAGWFSSDVIVEQGDTIVVPLYINENNTLDVWESVAKIMASFAVTVATINTLGII